jgi:phage terminase large subunit-like protein
LFSVVDSEVYNASVARTWRRRYSIAMRSVRRITPLRGMSEVVKLFLSEADVERLRKMAG